jgi:hypothetical protein
VTSRQTQLQLPFFHRVWQSAATLIVVPKNVEDHVWQVKCSCFLKIRLFACLLILCVDFSVNGKKFSNMIDNRNYCGLALEKRFVVFFFFLEKYGILNEYLLQTIL